MLLKAVAMFVLGMFNIAILALVFLAGIVMLALATLALATLAIVWTSGAWGKIALGVGAIMGISALLWSFRRPILAWANAVMEENSFSIGAIAVGVIFICIIGGGGAYSFLGGSMKELEIYFYPLGVIVVCLSLLGIGWYTNRHHQDG